MGGTSEAQDLLRRYLLGLSGLFTHSYGIRGQESEHNPELIEYRDDTLMPTYTSMMRLVTDGDLDAYTGIGSGFHRDELEWQAKHIKATTATLLIGVDAFDREYIWQRLWYAKRFSYPRIEDKIDFMLWDFASRHAKLPLYKLLGRLQREDTSVREYRRCNDRRSGCRSCGGQRSKGFVGCKDHSYRGVNGNIEMAQELRAAVGDDFLLMHDPVENYTIQRCRKGGTSFGETQLFVDGGASSRLGFDGTQEVMRYVGFTDISLRVVRRGNRRTAL